MTAKDLINYLIPPVKPEDSIVQVQEWMEEFKVTELPVSHEGIFLGIIDEDMIYDDPEANVVGDLMYRGQDCSVRYDQHYYDVLSKGYNLGFRIVAVLDENEKYLGVVSIQDVVEAFAQASSVHNPGAIMVLQVKEKDYSLSNLARMIEMNDVKILSFHLTPSTGQEDSGTLQLTLKLDSEDISQIRTVLENNQIHVEATFNTSALSYDEKERLDLLMKYLKP